MKSTPQRLLILAAFGLLAAVISGCTLTGADAPPPATQIASLPTLPPTVTPVPSIPSPTPGATVDVFGTATAGALGAQGLTPGAPGGTPGTPGAVTTPGVGVTPVTGATPTPGLGLVTPVGTTPTASGSQTSSGTTTCPSTYTVAAGDTLFRIALRFSLTVQELATANGITNIELISVGQVLKIPRCGATTPSGGTTSGTTTGGTTTGGTGAGTLSPKGDDTVAPNGDILHTVKSGENLFRIALSYGLSWEVVAAYNGITNPNAISVGDVIRIPTK